MRAAIGFDAADYLIPGYWIWARAVENLAAIGYDSNNMIMESHDWRLRFGMLKERDRVFTRFQTDAERLVEHSDGKIVAIGHLMGANVWLYFMPTSCSG